jgi:hypothetical protein
MQNIVLSYSVPDYIYMLTYSLTSLINRLILG